ncbi:MAG: glycosyltransferase family 39 protein [bacterium]|nr:glycosyltransferase family 39 protein [bacterium]
MKLKPLLPYLIIALALGLRLAALLRYGDFWSDEMFSFVYSQKPLIPSLTKFWLWETNPPLHLAVLKIWFVLIPANEWTARLPSIIFGTAGVAAIYYSAKTFFTEKVALLAALAAALAPMVIFFSATARVYALLFLLAILSAHFTVQLFLTDTNNDRRTIFVYMLIQLLGMYAHLTFFFLLAAETATILILRRAKIWVWIKLHLLPFALWLVWAVPAFTIKLSQRNFQNSWFFNMQIGLATKFEQLKLIFTGPSNNIFAVIIMAVLITAVARELIIQKRQASIQEIFLVYLILAMTPLILAIVLGAINIKFLFIATPAILLLTGYLLRRVPTMVATIIIILIMVPGISQLFYHNLPINRWQDLSAYSADKYNANKKQLIIYNNFTIKNELEYYYHGPISILAFAPDSEDDWDYYLINNNYKSLRYTDDAILRWLKTIGYVTYDDIYILDGIFHHEETARVLGKNGYTSANAPYYLPILEHPSLVHFSKTI